MIELKVIILLWWVSCLVSNNQVDKSLARHWSIGLGFFLKCLRFFVLNLLTLLSHFGVYEYVLIENGMLILIICSRSKSMKSRTSFWRREGRMQGQWRSREARTLWSSRLGAQGISTHYVSSTKRRLISWSSLFLQVHSLFSLSLFTYTLHTWNPLISLHC